MAKKRLRRYAKAFRQMVVERPKHCENISELSKELGVHRRLLYTWRDQLDPAERGDSLQGNSRESTLRKKVSQTEASGG